MLISKTTLSKLQATAKVPGGPRNDFALEKAGNRRKEFEMATRLMYSIKSKARQKKTKRMHSSG